MNVALIFAGGAGKRMNTRDIPKQFLMVHGKPIIVHTIEVFERHPEIDGIVVVCLKDYIDHLKELKHRYRLDKMISIVPGGTTGQLSIYNGLKEAVKYYRMKDTVVLIHDGVRPLIEADLISRNIAGVKAHRACVTCGAATETFVLLGKDSEVDRIMDRSLSRMAKAPQSFYLYDILEKHEQALKDGYQDMIDSVTLMSHYGVKPFITECGSHNIKITTPDDFYIFRALYDAKENRQLNCCDLGGQ